MISLAAKQWTDSLKIQSKMVIGFVGNGKEAINSGRIYTNRSGHEDAGRMA